LVLIEDNNDINSIDVPAYILIKLTFIPHKIRIIIVYTLILMDLFYRIRCERVGEMRYVASKHSLTESKQNHILYDFNW